MSQVSGSVPPIAPVRPVTTTLHGDTLVDQYAWLRDRDDPAVRDYLEAENLYAELRLPAAAFREALYSEMLARIKQTDLSVPFPDGDWYYYSRTEEGKQYPIHCRSRTPGGEEHVLLDVNLLALGKAFMALGAFAVSDDGRLLAFSTDETGFREYRLQVKDLDTGDLLPFEVPRTGSVAWAADGRTLFYTIEDDAKRQYRVYRHRVDDGSQALVYEEPDEAFNVAVQRTRSRAWLVLASGSHTTSEASVLSAHSPDGAWQLLAPRVPDREYEVDHRGEMFLLRINDTGRNFRVVEVPVADPSPERWREIVPHDPAVMLEGLDCFADHWVLWDRSAGLPGIRIARNSGEGLERVPFPEPVYEVHSAQNRQWDTTTLRFAYESLVTPPSVFDFDVRTKERVLRKQQEVLGGYDPARYRCERLHAVAEDGTWVPISLVRRTEVPVDGTAAMLLSGYGAYGIPYPVSFSSTRLSLLDRGVIFAIAHVRGGGELGKPWHDAGRLQRKPNTFTDFIAVADHLVAERYAARARLAIEGGSAGGLLIGAVLNRRPDLCRAAVLQVPFLDVLNTMLDTTLPLTVGEFEEWGNPRERADYRVMATYCPYTNLRPAAYPAMLVRTSLHDSQVMYWEPAKYVARLRTRRTDTEPLLLVTNMGAGHGGASGRYDRLRELALDYAFVLDAVAAT